MEAYCSKHTYMIAYAVARMIIGVIDLLVQLIGTEEVDQVVHELLGLRGIKVMEKEDMINIFINMRCQLPFPPDVLQIFNVGVSPRIEHIWSAKHPKTLLHLNPAGLGADGASGSSLGLVGDKPT